MWNRIRTAAVPSVVVVLAAYGFAYAATGSPNPIDLVSHHGPKNADAVVSPKPTDSPEGTNDPADSPEASHTPNPSHGPVRSTTGCPAGFTGNHGQFVSQSADHHAAAQSDCGKPVHPTESPGVSPSSTDHPDDNGESIGHGGEQSPEPSESPDADQTGDQHSNGHTGNGGTSGS